MEYQYLAHEVYVLDRETIAQAMLTPSPNPFMAYIGNEYVFYLSGFIALVVVLTVFAATLFRAFEKRADPVLYALKKYALPVARITVGLCFVAFALSGNLYGSEVFLSDAFGDTTWIMQALLLVLGIGATVGIYTRAIGVGMLLVYATALLVYGTYILTYTDFLGAALLLSILGGGLYSVDSLLNTREGLSRLTHALQPLAFPLLRICFGFGVVYASVYAKFLHSELALAVVNVHDLTRFFPFDPLFVVLGALIIEFIAGLMVMFGVALRWALIFLAFWLTLSLVYFQELIWPHGILFGLAVALLLHGYDRYSLEGYFFKQNGREPVL
jgi:uncharacterized membrane protein YphA (DoxX/SURF4 family)